MTDEQAQLYIEENIKYFEQVKSKYGVKILVLTYGPNGRVTSSGDMTLAEALGALEYTKAHLQAELSLQKGLAFAQKMNEEGKHVPGCPEAIDPKAATNPKAKPRKKK